MGGEIADTLKKLYVVLCFPGCGVGRTWLLSFWWYCVFIFFFLGANKSKPQQWLQKSWVAESIVSLLS